MTTARCSRCGTALAPGASRCPRCGADAAGAGASPPPAASTALAGAPPDAEREAQLQTLRDATLGDYEILGELGRGGMATVYLAHDLALDRRVAIKVLAPALLLMGEGVVERFKREARTAAALSHPHIVPIHAVKESPGVLCFVMQYVLGRPLDSIVRDAGPLPIPMAQAIIAHVSDALSYAHRHGIIHRDIKCANIMLDEEGWAVVMDFGIAKVVEAEGLTLTGVTVGTPAYMSPEQCATREVTGASDQYSLGVVAYQMLTGKLPFRGDSILAIMYAHFNERPRPVEELRPDCPPGLAAAVMRMLEKDPAQRWPSMDDVIAACGRPSLRRDDPVRHEMIELAKAGPRARLFGQMRTPTSPIPRGKPGTRSATAVGPAARGAGAPATPGARLWWGLAVAAAAGVALWWAGPRVWERARAPRDTAAVSPAAAPVPPDTPAPAPGPAPESAAVQAPARRPPEPRLAGPKQSPARRPLAAPGAVVESVTGAVGAQREDSSVKTLRVAALTAMRHALDAGATPAELAKGDTVFRAAESLATHGRSSQAIVPFALAASLWTEAERAARSRVARDTPRPPPAEPPVAPPRADPRVEIEAVIARYARALESRDLGDVRRAYPGLTSAQQEQWRDFFRTARKLKASLTVTGLRVEGGSAEAIVSAVYEYENAETGRTVRLPETFRALLVAEPEGWRLSTVR